MRGRTVLFVALALLVALGGFFAGWSSGAPQAVADPTATPPGPVAGHARKAGSGPSRTPAGHVPKAPSTKGPSRQGSQQPGTPPKSTTPKGVKPPAPLATQEPQHTGPVRFGKLTTAGRPNLTDVSPDHQALTTTFDDFEVTMDRESAEPDATKSFSMTMPLTDGAEGQTLRVYVQGYAFVADGAKAKLTLRGGHRSIIKGFLPGSNDSFLEPLELPATPGATYQLSVIVEIHKAAGSEGDGYLNAISIDAEIS
jgi:hypothetical protein